VTEAERKMAAIIMVMLASFFLIFVVIARLPPSFFSKLAELLE
jgi:hypothetical protein